MPGRLCSSSGSRSFSSTHCITSLFGGRRGVQVQYDFGFDVAAVRHGCGELVNGGLEFVAAVRSDSRDFDGVAEGYGGFGGVKNGISSSLDHRAP